MEAKVDLQKLQLLNDRISQTLDALNQVRVSVSGAQAPGFAAGSIYGGLQHSTANQQLPQAPMFGGVGVGVPGFIPQVPFGMQTQAPGSIYGGLQHSTANQQLIERRLAESQSWDPNRIAATFPYAFTRI